MGNACNNIHYDKYIDFHSLAVYDNINDIGQIVVLLVQQNEHLNHILQTKKEYNVVEIGKIISRLINLNFKMYEFIDINDKSDIVNVCKHNDLLLTTVFRGNMCLTLESNIVKEINKNINLIRNYEFH